MKKHFEDYYKREYDSWEKSELQLKEARINPPDDWWHERDKIARRHATEAMLNDLSTRLEAIEKELKVQEDYAEGVFELAAKSAKRIEVLENSSIRLAKTTAALAKSNYEAFENVTKAYVKLGLEVKKLTKKK